MKRQAYVLPALLAAVVALSGCALDVGLNPSATAQPTTAPATTTATTGNTAHSAPSGAEAPTQMPALPVAEAEATATPETQANPAPAPAVAPQSAAALAPMESAFESIYEAINPSVVLIQVSVPASASGGQQANPFFGSPQGGAQQALGSGFVWDKQGHIVTNNHVIAGANNIVVTFYDGQTVSAKLVGADPNADLAVISVSVSQDRLRPVTLGDSTKVKVGQVAIAIGNPFGEQNTMTMGIISALGRSLPVDQGTASGPSYTISDIIQTDAPINPGNSGGVLLDARGEVIGVTSAIESPVEASSGIGFAVPSAIVQKVVPTLISTGHYDHPWMGISGASLTPDLAQAMNLPPDQRGALVAEVVQGSPAQKAGLKGGNNTVTIQGQQGQVGGDVIVAINGQTINTFDEMISYLDGRTQVGETITVTILRNGQKQDLKVTLQARPNTSSSGSPSAEAGGGAYLGVTGTDLTPDIAKAMNLPSGTQGALIQQVAPNGPADSAGLIASTQQANIGGQTVPIGGDVIIGYASQPVTSMDDLSSYLAQSAPGQRVTVIIIRDGQQGRVRVMLEESPTSEIAPARFMSQ